MTATKKKIANRRLEVVKIKGSHKKNGFNFREVMGQTDDNVITHGRGYDTYSQALRAAGTYNTRLQEKYRMPIYYDGIQKGGFKYK